LKKGTFYAAGALVSNRRAELSTEPDGTFVLWETFRSGRLKLLSRRPGEYMELLGSPDWVMEVVSESSLAKDTERLPRLYHKARISEYWLINALGEEIDFQLLRWQKTGYKRVPVKDGWQRSPLFCCWFHLTRQEDRLGYWEYTLEVRE
jgi:Uma2 family endonuclease